MATNLSMSNWTVEGEEPYGIYVANIINNVFGVLAILLNIIFLVCIFNVPNNDSAYNRFIKNLSVCDIFGALFFLLTLNWPQGPFAHILAEREDNILWIHGLPYVFRSIPWMFFTVYMFTLNCLSVSQYFASCKPHLYFQVCQSKNVTMILVLVWGLSSLQILIPFIVMLSLSRLPVREAFERLFIISKVEMTVWMLVYITSTCVSITLNVMVYLQLRTVGLRNKQEVCGVDSAAADVDATAASGGERIETTTSDGHGSGGENTGAKNEALVTILCLSLASIFCRLPLPLVGMLLIAIIEERFGYVVMSWTLVIVVFLLYLVFSVEPVIYMCRMPDVRTLLKDTVQQVRQHRRFRRNRPRGDRFSLVTLSSLMNAVTSSAPEPEEAKLVTDAGESV